MSTVNSSSDSLCGTEKQLVTSTESLSTVPSSTLVAPLVAVHSGGQNDRVQPDHTAAGEGPGRAGPASNCTRVCTGAAAEALVWPRAMVVVTAAMGSGDGASTSAEIGAEAGTEAGAIASAGAGVVGGALASTAGMVILSRDKRISNTAKTQTT